jgi:hypothetical protein
VAFGGFAVGSGVVAGLLLAVGAIVAVYEHLNTESKKAKEEADKLTKSLNDQADARLNATEAGQRALVAKADSNVANAKAATGGGFFSTLLQGMAPGGQSMNALTSGDAAAKVKDIAFAARGAQEQVNQLGEAIGKKNDKIAADIKRIADEALAVAAKADAAFQKRIDLLSKGLVFEDTRKTVTTQLIAIEHTLEAQLNSGTQSLERRIVASQRLSQVMDALNQKFIVAAKYTDVGQLIGITPNSDTAAARAYAAYGQPMDQVKRNNNNGILVQPGQYDYIGIKQAGDLKALENADKNSENLKNAIWGAAQQSAFMIVNALNIGGGGRGSQLGGALGSTGGTIGGMMIGAKIGTIGGAPGMAVGAAIGAVIGTIGGSFLGGLFDSNKKAVNANTEATRANTAAMIQFAPSGFKIEPYRYQASDPKQIMQNFRQYGTRGGAVSFGT